MTTSLTRPAHDTESGRHQTARRPPMSAPPAAEQLLFRYDPTELPSITYWSLPHRCTGRADTLDGARRLYRATMTGMLGISRRELPAVAEHLEALLGDMWVRTRMGAAHRDAVSDRMFVQTLLSAGPAQDAMRADLTHPNNAGIRPVVVIAEPDDTVGSVLDQMRADDTVLVVHSDAHSVLRWIVLYGPGAAAAVDGPGLPDDSVLAATPINALTEAFATENPRAVRLHECDIAGCSAPVAV